MKIVKIEERTEFQNKIYIGQHLDKVEQCSPCHEVYGLAINVPNTHMAVLKGFKKPETITKSEARELLISELDKSLDILFDPKEMERVDKELNVNMDHLID